MAPVTLEQMILFYQADGTRRPSLVFVCLPSLIQYSTEATP